MKNEIVLIAGYYGFDNAGDELILLSLIQQLKKENPACEIAVLSCRPELTRKRYGVEAVDRWRAFDWIAPFRKARRFILGGGGLLQESTSSWNHIYYLSLLCLAKCFGCRTEVRSVGVDPISNALNRWMTQLVFRFFVDQASVRDKDSRDALEASGVLGVIQIRPDPVFQLKIPITPENARDSAPIAMAISPWPERPAWSQEVAELIERVSKALHVRVELLIFFPEEDSSLTHRIADLTGDAISVRTWSHPEEVLDWMRNYGLIIGMRYHALALAALAGRPFIGWGYQRKVTNLCRDFNQPLWTFERGWDEEAVFRQICEAWRRRDILPERFQTQVRANLCALT